METALAVPVVEVGSGVVGRLDDATTVLDAAGRANVVCDRARRYNTTIAVTTAGNDRTCDRKWRTFSIVVDMYMHVFPHM